MIRPVTRALLDDAQRFSAIYRGYLADHVPMGLVALDALGATDSELHRFKRANEAKLEPLGDAERGRIDALQARIARDGLARTFAPYAADLAAGIGTAAFHGAIRLAYAVESGHEREQAHALAYWTFALERLPVAPPPAGRETPLEVLRAVASDPRHARRRPPGRNIAERMASAAADPAFAGFAARLDPRQSSVEAFAFALIRAYAATGDFTILHGVTGCQAFQRLAPFLPENADATRHLWTAVVAAFMASGSPSPGDWGLEGDDTLDWPAIRRRAAACDDEHDVKFAYSCWREWERTGDALYRRAASARVAHAVEAETH